MDISFTEWAALISNEQWRQQLYNKRLGKEKNTIQINLSQWFQQPFSVGWQPIDIALTSAFGP